MSKDYPVLTLVLAPSTIHCGSERLSTPNCNLVRYFLTVRLSSGVGRPHQTVTMPAVPVKTATLPSLGLITIISQVYLLQYIYSRMSCLSSSAVSRSDYVDRFWSICTSEVCYERCKGNRYKFSTRFYSSLFILATIYTA